MFGSIVNEGYLNSSSEGEQFCIYNRNPNACSYGVAVGVLAFLTCLLYLALDAYFPQISSVKDRKKAVLSDIGVSGEPCTLGVSPAQESAEGWPRRGPADLHACLQGSCHPSPVFQMRKLKCRRVKGWTWGHMASSREWWAGPGAVTPGWPPAPQWGWGGVTASRGLISASRGLSVPPPW